MTRKEARQLRPGVLLRSDRGRYFLVTSSGLELVVPAKDKLRFDRTAVLLGVADFLRTGPILRIVPERIWSGWLKGWGCTETIGAAFGYYSSTVSWEYGTVRQRCPRLVQHLFDPSACREWSSIRVGVASLDPGRPRFSVREFLFRGERALTSTERITNFL
jgi:hypothetical protein